MQPTATRIRDDIHNLREQTTTLEALANRRIRVTHDTGRAHMSCAPTPISLPAYDLLRSLDGTIRSIALGAGLRFGRDTDMHSLLKGLDRPEPCETLAERPDAWAHVRLIAETTWRIKHLTEPDPSRRYIGICPQCGQPAWAPETQPADTDYRCHDCGHLTPIANIIEAHQLRLLTSGTVGTSKTLRTTLNACGIHINAGTIRQWAHRGKLKPTGTDDDGTPVYALADVLLLHRGLDKQRV